MIRPAVIATNKVDAIIGNPPWLTYNQSADIICEELKSLSEKRYRIWAGGKNSSHQDGATLFYCRAAELYLKEKGDIGMHPNACEVDKQEQDDRMRARWEKMERLWEANRGKNYEKSLTQRLNYHNILTSQLEYLRNPGQRPGRIAYTTCGRPTAAPILRIDKQS